MSRILSFKSPEFRLRVERTEEPFSTIVDDWTLTEHVVPQALSSRLGSPYSVSLEYALKFRDEAGSMFINGEYHVRALEKAWLYATGLTMSGMGYEYMLSPSALPLGWTSNAASILSETEWSLLQDGATYTPQVRSASALPLRSAVDVIWALARADDLTIQLSTYHFDAVTAMNPDRHLLLFAQAIEMGRALLPGKSKAEQARLLPTGISTRLARGIDWLFEMSNQRRQTRHVIDKQVSIALKPDFDDQEQETFLHDAHLLIQYLVASRLSLPIMICENGSTVQAA